MSVLNRIGHAAAAALLCALYMGCGTVPDVTFAPDDASDSDDQDAAVNDGAANDDAGIQLCGGRPLPAGASCCENHVACLGDCTAADDCRTRCEMLDCPNGRVCCTRSGPGGNALCVRPDVDSCP